MDTSLRLARTAGLYYLVVAVCGGFAHVVRLQVYVAGDAAATTENVAAHETLVRLSFVADLVSATFMVFLVLALHRLLSDVSPRIARTMVALVIAFVPIICLNMVHQLGALLVASESSYAATFGSETSEGLVLLLMDLQHHGYLVAQIFFGLWLWPLGRLALLSGRFPRIIGYLLMAATVAYLVDVAAQFLASEDVTRLASYAVAPVVLAGELSMLGYLLVRGIRPRPDALPVEDERRTRTAVGV